MRTIVFLCIGIMLAGAVKAQHGIPGHDIFHSFSHDARPTFYTNTDTVEHNSISYAEIDTFGCEINPMLHIGGFQVEIEEIIQDTTGGHVITGIVAVEGSKTNAPGSYVGLASQDFRFYIIGDKILFNYDADCHSAAGLIGGPNKYRYYRITVNNHLTGWGYFKCKASLLLR